jgi:hypothetical protein
MAAPRLATNSAIALHCAGIPWLKFVEGSTSTFSNFKRAYAETGTHGTEGKAVVTFS